MIERIAAWVTLITGPLTVLSIFSAWFGRLDALSRTVGHDSSKAEILAVLIITFSWCFLISAMLWVFVLLSRKLSEFATFVMSILVGFLVLTVFCAIEMLILDSLVPRASSWPLIMLGWLIPPVLLWLLFGYFALVFVVSGEFEKDAG